MKSCKTLILAVCIVPLVSGCALFRDSGKTQYSLRSSSPVDLVSGAAELAKGREFLDQQQYGLAITAFRNARLDPVQAAAANNGLGIAYARLDRFDLAERYFRAAIAAAPDEERYQANLSRLHRSTQAWAARTARPAATVAAPTQPVVRTLIYGNGATVVRVEFPTARAVQVSNNEVHIAAPAASDGRRIRPGASMASVTATTPERRINPAARMTISGGK